MHGEPLRFRSQRRTRSARRASSRRAQLLVAGFAVCAIGAACWSPISPIAIGPFVAQGAAVGVATLQPTSTSPAHAAVPAQATLAPTAQPTRPPQVPAPQPQPVATPSTGGLALLASIRSDHDARWVKNHSETALRAGPSDAADSFTTLPQWTLLKQTDSRPDWLMVQYSGDGDTRQAGPGWVKASDVGAVDAPSVWLQASHDASVWSTADATARLSLRVPSSTLMEVVGPDIIQGSRVHVRLPGDGRQVPPAEGWLDADALARTGAPDYTQVPRAYPADLHADVRIQVPYRTQLDGSAYAGANCGPTALGMALESFGMNEPAPDLRREVLRTETFSEDDDDAGTYIWALADVAQGFGLHASGLYEPDGTTLHHWSVDEVRAAVRQGHPVIVQVVYRGLPGREASEYYGDHYVVITGLLGDDLLYNDPIGGATAHESPGYDRVITAAQLERAMHASDTGYAFTAFSLSRG